MVSSYQSAMIKFGRVCIQKKIYTYSFLSMSQSKSTVWNVDGPYNTRVQQNFSRSSALNHSTNPPYSIRCAAYLDALLRTEIPTRSSEDVTMLGSAPHLMAGYFLAARRIVTSAVLYKRRVSAVFFLFQFKLSKFQYHFHQYNK